MSVEKKKPAILPETVCELLNECELRGELGTMVMRAGTVHELLTVWLRVAALHETLEPGPSAARSMVEALLFGAPQPEDTEPYNEKPEVPTLKCTCGYHGPATEDFGCPHCGEVVA